MTSLEQRLERAHIAQDKELWALVRDTHPQVILNVTLNRSLNEEMALFLGKMRTTPAEALGFLAGDIRFKDNLQPGHTLFPLITIQSHTPKVSTLVPIPLHYTITN